MTHLSCSGEPVTRAFVALTDHMLVRIVKDHFDGVFTVAPTDPGVSIFLTDHHGDAMQFSHVIMKGAQGLVGLAGAVLLKGLNQIKGNTLRVTSLDHVAGQEPDQLRALEESHGRTAGRDL